MNKGVWCGNHLLQSPKVLILSESHYDGENYGENVPFSTTSVVNRYFEQHEKWSAFFSRIAASFGYQIENARSFYDRVYFGNYVDVICGIGTDHAKNYISLNRQKLNDDLFRFVNENSIDLIVCFSKLVYNSLPSLNQYYSEEQNIKTKIGTLGSKRNYAEYCTYLPGIEHPNCGIPLIKTLRVYGVGHPSAQGGFDSNQVNQFFLKQQDVSVLCVNSPFYRRFEAVQMQQSDTDLTSKQEDVPLSPYDEALRALFSDLPVSGNERQTVKTNPSSYPITPAFDGQVILRILLPFIVASGLCAYGLYFQKYLVLPFALIPIILFFRGISALKNRCPNCRAWDPWIVKNERLIKEDRVKVRRSLGSMYYRTSGRTTFGVRQTFVSAEEKTFELLCRCRVCNYETKRIVTNIDDKIRG